MTEKAHVRPPAHIEVYVDVLGADLAVEFFLSFGGAELYLAAAPKRSRLVEVVGTEKARALAGFAHRLPARVPVPKQWLARHLKTKGLSNADIARKLHVTDVTVRSYLQGTGLRADHDPRQLPLI